MSMKRLAITVFLLAGCQQLQHGQMQPIKLIDAKNNIYFTSCSGAVEESSSCKDKAYKTCPNGYLIIDKVESAVGGRRELTFQCKK